jgi:hypothetical protein
MDVCLRCYEFVGHKPTPRRCRCVQLVDRYHELALYDHANYVVGNPDVILRNRDHYVPIEVKSMVKDQWESLRSPLGDHVMQAMRLPALATGERLPRAQ